jgi:hypothetical protein
MIPCFDLNKIQYIKVSLLKGGPFKLRFMFGVPTRFSLNEAFLALWVLERTAIWLMVHAVYLYFCSNHLGRLPRPWSLA